MSYSFGPLLAHLDVVEVILYDGLQLDTSQKQLQAWFLGVVDLDIHSVLTPL